MPALTNYLDRALSGLSKIGIAFQDEESKSNAILPVLQKIQALDEVNALSIARTMQHSSAFNQLVRERISSIEVGSRYIDIAEQFEGIREDTSNMVSWMEDGKLDWVEKAKITWIKLKRGNVSDRFNDIRTFFLDVIGRTEKQLSKEELVLNAYKEFRLAIKQAEIAAQAILQRADCNLRDANAALEKHNEALKSKNNTEGETLAKLELIRDEALNEHSIADEQFQISSDLVNNLKIAYSTSEVVYARLEQNIKMKKRIYQQSVTFFSTNEIVFSALSSAFTSTQGLAESANALTAITTGVNKSIEALAVMGNHQLEQSAKAGYGATIDAKSVAKLADAIVQYQSDMRNLVKDLREEATKNANEIEIATNDAKDRFVQLVSRG